MAYEVGKYYKVVCMEHTCIEKGKKNIFVPIVDIWHKDAQFGADFFHYHIDGRFTDKYIDEHFDIEDGYTNLVIDNRREYYYNAVGKVVKLRKCRRLTTGLFTFRTPKIYWDWRNTMVGKSCAGKRCPHLGTEMSVIDGRLICPLHNLIGDIQTEKIINA